MANRTDLIAKVAEVQEVTKKDAAVIVDNVVTAMEDLLLETGELAVPQFGKFTTAVRPAREAVNPQDPTGAKISVPAKTVVKFKAAGGQTGLATRANA